jgi:hypothetical protein
MPNEVAKDASTQEPSVETMPMEDLRSRTREAHRLIDQARAMARASFAAEAQSPESAEDAARKVRALVDAAHRLLPGLRPQREDAGDGVRGPARGDERRFGIDAKDAVRAMVAVLHSDAAREEDVQRALAEAGIDVASFLDSMERAELIERVTLDMKRLADEVEADRATSFHRLGVQMTIEKLAAKNRS